MTVGCRLKHLKQQPARSEPGLSLDIVDDTEIERELVGDTLYSSCPWYAWNFIWNHQTAKPLYKFITVWTTYSSQHPGLPQFLKGKIPHPSKPHSLGKQGPVSVPQHFNWATQFTLGNQWAHSPPSLGQGHKARWVSRGPGVTRWGRGQTDWTVNDPA